LDFQGDLLWRLLFLGCLLLFLLLRGLLLFLFTASIYLTDEDDVEFDVILSVLEVARDRNFNYRRIVL